MTTITFAQDHGVGTIVPANPPANRIGSLCKTSSKPSFDKFGVFFGVSTFSD